MEIHHQLPNPWVPPRRPDTALGEHTAAAPRFPNRRTTLGAAPGHAREVGGWMIVPQMVSNDKQFY